MAEVESGFSSGTYSYDNDARNAGNGSGMSGGSRSGGGFAGSIGYTAHGISNSIGYYGSWYEGEQLNDYYNKKAELTYREKQAYVRSTDYQIGQLRQASVDASRDAANAERINEYKEEKYQEQTDSGVSSILARGAAQGVDMSYGSPLEYLSKVIDDRSESYAMLKWEDQNDVYKRQRYAADLSDKATIMLDEQRMMEANYDYQAEMYKRAAGDARRAARYKSYQAGLSVG